MKGIILAGGSGTRLGACTWAVSKQLLPIYDKPMIYYPLSVLMLAGIRDITIITNPSDQKAFYTLLGDGTSLGCKFSYTVQESPRGIADALIVCADFLNGEDVCLILGDNIFYGQGFVDTLTAAKTNINGALVFGYPVTNPSDFGIVELDSEGTIISLEEKPEHPKSNLAIPGLYFYDSRAVEFAQNLAPSPRGELEITDLNRCYLDEDALSVVELGRGMAWLDTGTPQGLLQASQFVETIQARQGLYIACIEEVAWRMGFISPDELLARAKCYQNTHYGNYLAGLIN